VSHKVVQRNVSRRATFLGLLPWMWVGLWR